MWQKRRISIRLNLEHLFVQITPGLTSIIQWKFVHHMLYRSQFLSIFRSNWHCDFMHQLGPSRYLGVLLIRIIGCVSVRVCDAPTSFSSRDAASLSAQLSAHSSGDIVSVSFVGASGAFCFERAPRDPWPCPYLHPWPSASPVPYEYPICKILNVTPEPIHPVSGRTGMFIPNI